MNTAGPPTWPVGHDTRVLQVQSVIEVAEALAQTGVQYLIVGGLAVVAHGYTRLSQNMDLVACFREGDAERVVKCLQSLGYQACPPATLSSVTDPKTKQSGDAVGNPDSLVLRKQRPGKPISEVNLVLHVPFDFNDAYAKALWLPIDQFGTTVPFLDLASLTQMKQTTRRPKDLLDIAQLTAIQGAPLQGTDFHEVEQRRREAEQPLWARLQWIEEMGRMAITIQQGPPQPPPPWAAELITKEQKRRESSDGTP